MFQDCNQQNIPEPTDSARALAVSGVPLFGFQSGRQLCEALEFCLTLGKSSAVDQKAKPGGKTKSNERFLCDLRKR